MRVAVSSTPGKTKHFQTLNVTSELMLCDCPGLVFPSFMRSTGEMICAGVLPINQMRDYVEPANVIASRVPMHLLNAAYGMQIKRQLDIKDNPNRPPTGHEMLHAYCEVKTYITNGTGNWDEFRGCKELLRDFNDGRILFVASPPSLKQYVHKIDVNAPLATAVDERDYTYSAEMQRWLAETESLMLRKERVADRVAKEKIREIETEQRELLREEQGEDESEENDDDKPRKHVSKRRECWGKKSRKLRDKDPYAVEKGTINYVAYTTNRPKLNGEKQEKVTRHSTSKSYGTEYVNRALFPHHISVQKAKEVEA